MNEDHTNYTINQEDTAHAKFDGLICHLDGCNVVVFEPKPGQKYCCPEHKDEAWKRVRDEASRKMNKKGRSHSGTLANSPRLRTMLRALSDYKEHTTKELCDATGDMAVHSTISDLRHNAFIINCRYLRTEKGRRIYGYKLVKHGG